MEKDVDRGSQKASAGKRRGRELAWFVVLFALSFALIFGFVRPVVAAPSVVDGISMKPTLQDGDRVMVVKPEALVGQPGRGDVVLIEGENGGEDLIKRVAALPGETVSVRGNTIYVDGEPLPGSNATRDTPGLSGFGTKVPPGQVYVLGDNRDQSSDSRSFGPVSTDRIAGEAVVKFWPLNHIATL